MRQIIKQRKVSLVFGLVVWACSCGKPVAAFCPNQSRSLLQRRWSSLSTTTTSSCKLLARRRDNCGASTGSNVPSSSESTMSGDEEQPSTQRRSFLQGATTTLAAASLGLASSTMAPNAARAGLPEIDSSGLLFSPKADMLSGGSEAARGIPIKGSRTTLQPGQTLQTVYETRFIAYLSRFLLNFDPAANAWWVDQGYGASWSSELRDVYASSASSSNPRPVDYVFAEFAESVEVGLADYFVGPYGSYSSLAAAKAGILAGRPAPSLKPDSETARRSILAKVVRGDARLSKVSDPDVDSVRLAKQGILNLFTLLKARYNSVAAKRQLAILFSFISSPRLQPTEEIRGLLGETDNARIETIQLIRPELSRRDEMESRTSARRGGGYAVDALPEVTVASPPALGSEYKSAQLQPVMQPTSRVLRIRVVDGGEGYEAAPPVSIMQSGSTKSCQAATILDREGHVESIIVLDAGYGYGGRTNDLPPRVVIDPPKKRSEQTRRARAVADLEYEVAAIEVLDGGSGYVSTEPPKVKISPPAEDPDWFLSIQEQPALRMIPVGETPTLKARVATMTFADGNVAYSVDGIRSRPGVDEGMLERVQRDPVELLPSAIRPERRAAMGSIKPVYTIPSLANIPQFVAVLNPRFRGQDPVFGGVGKLPVTRGASALSTSEYARLALSGAVCTVVVRTALNPLELIKTKQQLLNDQELLNYAAGQRVTNLIDCESREGGAHSSTSKNRAPDSFKTHEHTESLNVALAARREMAEPVVHEQDETNIAPVGTLGLIQALVSLRGRSALFQSADITFLASLVFGSFGFGATELFRRSFAAFFFRETGDSPLWSEIAFLMAAAFATVITAAAASPFEVLRVKSMGLLEQKKWTEVLKDYVTERNGQRESSESFDDFDLKSLRLRDVLPLWSGFAPIVSRELPFAVVKFLTFDLIAKTIIEFLNSAAGDGALPLQVGVGSIGLAVSAASGALAGIAGAIVSHPADLILTQTSSSSSRSKETTINGDSTDVNTSPTKADWRTVVEELLAREGGITNLFVGLPARATFFFLVIGLQFFLYDYVKNIFRVGSDDLSLVLDIFYAVRAGLVD